MDLDRIEELLEKYWDGETTTDEEKKLRSFFSAGQVPEKWKPVAPLFQYFEKEKRDGELDGLFDERVLAEIEAIEDAEKPSTGKGRGFHVFFDVAKVAAVGLILIVAGYFVREEYMVKNDRVDHLVADTFEDPREAYEETKKALMMISANFNKGRKEVRKIGTFNDAREKITNQDKDK